MGKRPKTITVIPSHPFHGHPGFPGGAGYKPPKKRCCAMVAAVGAARRGKYRLAGRYAQMSVRLIAVRLG